MLICGSLMNNFLNYNIIIWSYFRAKLGCYKWLHCYTTRNNSNNVKINLWLKLFFDGTSTLPSHLLMVNLTVELEARNFIVILRFLPVAVALLPGRACG